MTASPTDVPDEIPPSAGGGAATAVAEPRLASATVGLRAIGHHDYDRLRLLELSGALQWRWRHGGTTPSPEAWAASLWNGVFAQFLVTDRRTGEWIGIVSTYNADTRNQFAYVAAAKFDPTDRSSRLLEGVILFLDYLFRTWPFRKLYFEVPGHNMGQLRSGVGWLLTEEGRLRDHLWLDGDLWDLHVLAMHRDTWAEHQEGLVRFATERGT